MVQLRKLSNRLAWIIHVGLDKRAQLRGGPAETSISWEFNQ